MQRMIFIDILYWMNKKIHIFLIMFVVPGAGNLYNTADNIHTTLKKPFLIKIKLSVLKPKQRIFHWCSFIHVLSYHSIWHISSTFLSCICFLSIQTYSETMIFHTFSANLKLPSWHGDFVHLSFAGISIYIMQEKMEYMENRKETWIGNLFLALVLLDLLPSLH